jgi:hypothetical protein
MAYVNCSGCGVSTLTFAGWSTVDACPWCDASLRRSAGLTPASVPALESGPVEPMRVGEPGSRLLGTNRSLERRATRVIVDRQWAISYEEWHRRRVDPDACRLPPLDLAAIWS